MAGFQGDIFMTKEENMLQGLRFTRCSGAKSWSEIPCISKISPLNVTIHLWLKSHLLTVLYKILSELKYLFVSHYISKFSNER